ncbi:restriction endonuclease subunit S [Campylobacter sp.]|uniref:restriction endonuclease subunit S n=1 Tax=Campylobacter sp. TaxID=205 RepID=UPI002AA7FB33|nr:restriction endonuclease subunit S [Campylobacter sp.]MCI6564995.1 restriction endonuclease subunit S [Campylobacter sp.]MCI6580235.1 restriction endonuclease subunit S [Campylobacter sp.]MCI7014581.1 restriction endonuclease subunit S [Campylobacter sp.]
MKSPKIRFKEFQNEWNLTTLGEVGEIVGGGTPDTSNLKFWGDDIVWVTPTEIKNKYIFGSQRKISKLGLENSSAKLLEKNTILITSRATIGEIAITKVKCATNQGFQSLKLKKEHNYEFFYYALLLCKNKMLTVANGSTFVEISASQMKNLKTKIPTDLKEQNAIGEFFRKIDGILDLENSRFKKLKNFKKTMLDKLFVKDGADEPQIRLGSFKGEWNSRILGDIFKERAERSAVGELLSVSILKGVTKFNELNRWDKSSQDKSNYKVVKKGDIAYNSMRMWQGASGLSKYDGIVSPAYTILEPCENTNSLFFSYMFKKDEMLYKFRIKSQGLTSDTWNLKYTNLKSIEVRIPSDIKEQEAIGEFFRKIDGILEFSQKKITKLENIKKYLLNKMFV